MQKGGMMGSLIDLTGKRFGRLTVVKRAENVKNRPCWVCKCDCGNTKIIKGDDIRYGKTLSCGCYARDALKRRNFKHGYTQGRINRLYSIWASMKNRTTNSNTQFYARYGGRGIKMCKEWLDSFSSFKDWAESNGYKDDLTIDRIDNEKGYYPQNCRWTTMTEQMNNTCVNTHYRFADGFDVTRAELLRMLGTSKWKQKTRMEKYIAEKLNYDKSNHPKLYIVSITYNDMIEREEEFKNARKI